MCRGATNGGCAERRGGSWGLLRGTDRWGHMPTSCSFARLGVGCLIVAGGCAGNVCAVLWLGGKCLLCLGLRLFEGSVIQG